ncbi:MAG: aconitase X catalytic domain-containing protein [Roseiarcus sp.]|jgi:predicted aconitase
MRLTAFEQDMANGRQGGAAAFAMDILTRFGEAVGAPGLIEISRAHVDGCLHHGEVSLDFVERLAAEGGQVRAPTTLNVGSIDLIHPELIGGAPALRAAGRRLMEAHLALGCAPTFTCAPYQTRFRPRFGDQIAWGESNAIVFANSVIGARTNRYGDFIDLCCAMTGRAPDFGLHRDENRHGEILFRLRDAHQPTDALYVAVGCIVGARSGDRVPVIEGLPPPRSEDQLKALGAVAASAGAVGLFHAVGITPEAPSRRDAFGGAEPSGEAIDLSPEDFRRALARLSTAPDGAPISAVCLGTPHFSLAEFQALAPLVAGFRAARGVAVYVNTGRDTRAALAGAGLLAGLEAAGLTIVADTCTYVTTLLRRLEGVVMTNSGKWAHYAPGNIGVEVAFGSLEDCLASAAEGRVVRRAP